ncbi:MAG TPA: hypothetical protein VFM34_01150, partial [Moraxellaceae bacterium]|nr:hypothetical protein [Moraxellaceae bacterium]
MSVLTHAPLEEWLCLWRLVQQSLACTRRLLLHFDSPGSALAADPDRWRSLGISSVHANRLARWQGDSAAGLRAELSDAVAADVAWCEAAGHGVLAFDHDSYPAL